MNESISSNFSTNMLTPTPTSSSTATTLFSTTPTSSSFSSTSPTATTLSRYETQKRRDWNTFGQFLRDHQPPLTISQCSGAHIIEFVRYLDQFGKTKVHTQLCPFFGRLLMPSSAVSGQPMRKTEGSGSLTHLELELLGFIFLKLGILKLKQEGSASRRRGRENGHRHRVVGTSGVEKMANVINCNVMAAPFHASTSVGANMNNVVEVIMSRV